MKNKTTLIELDKEIIAPVTFLRINLPNLPERTLTKKTNELNLYIPEKWNY